MRNVTKISKLNGKVYVYLKDEVIADKFLRDAENEGFTFCDGVKPITRPGNNLYVVNKDWTITHDEIARYIGSAREVVTKV